MSIKSIWQINAAIRLFALITSVKRNMVFLISDTSPNNKQTKTLPWNVTPPDLQAILRQKVVRNWTKFSAQRPTAICSLCLGFVKYRRTFLRQLRNQERRKRVIDWGLRQVVDPGILRLSYHFIQNFRREFSRGLRHLVNFSPKSLFRKRWTRTKSTKQVRTNKASALWKSKMQAARK